MYMSEYILFIVSLIFFLIVIGIIRFIIKQLKSRSHMRLFNLEEYLPAEEIQTLEQVFYLVMMTSFIINIFYQLIFNTNDLIYFAIFDISLCLFSVSLFNVKRPRDYLLMFALLPFASVSYIYSMYQTASFMILDLLHFFALVYMVKFLYNRFKKFTKSNELGYTILLLFGIVFVSFIWTAFVEKVNLLDSLVMVSNAFTSNGYAILGSTILGKLNAIFLVWSGYVLSGVGTATLTVALMIRYYSKRFDRLEEKIEELKKEK